MLSEMLSRIANEYDAERKTPYETSHLRTYATTELSAEARKHTIFLPYTLKVKASVGQFNNWAAVPWLAFFDPLVSTGAQNGYYVVFLINCTERTFVLSLNQGTTVVYNEFGPRDGCEVLKRRALDMRLRIEDIGQNFNFDPIELSSDAALPTGYMAGHILGKTYSSFEVDEQALSDDLGRMFEIYAALIKRGGAQSSESMNDEANTTDIAEARRYSFSRRIERNQSVRKEVIKSKGKLVCEACGLNPEKDYNYRGEKQKIPLDVHHIIPMHSLKENEVRRYKIPEDFLLLCPTCHRMIHQQSDPSDLEKLKRSIGFRHLREVYY